MIKFIMPITYFTLVMLGLSASYLLTSIFRMYIKNTLILGILDTLDKAIIKIRFINSKLLCLTLLVVLMIISIRIDQNFLLSLIMNYTVCYLVLCTANLFSLNTNVEISYSQTGDCKDWYDVTKRYMGTNWIHEFMDFLGSNHILDFEKEQLNFISVSANNAVYEKEIFNIVSKIRTNSTFIASDICILKNHEVSYTDTHRNNFFIYKEGKDARHINGTLEEERLNDVDFIMDFKGCLWYSTIQNKSRNCSETVGILAKYLSQLSRDGIIIIDNFESTTFERIINYIKLHTIKKTNGFAERSTWKRIQKCSRDTETFIMENFETIEFVSDTNKKIKIIVLKRK